MFVKHIIGLLTIVMLGGIGCNSEGDDDGGGGGPVENSGIGCTLPEFKWLSDADATEKLPDPFTFENGQPVTSESDWQCRRAEIGGMFQQFELGEKPAKPESVTGEVVGNDLKVTVTHGGKTISFTAGIQLPAGEGPHPAIIAYGTFGSSLNSVDGVGTITYNNDEIAEQMNTDSRGKGKFYELYGEDHTAGALMAWAWGISRIIDALETTPAAGIDPHRLGVTGCSRNGKGAMVAGAFDERIALTIPQESGAGGAASWRLSDYMQDQGANVQTLGAIISENVWFTGRFYKFNGQTEKLPVDHHMLIGMIAPRGLLIIENTDMEWLGNLSCYGAAVVGQHVYQALDASEAFTFSQVGQHDHCALPSSQYHWVTSYAQKYLLAGEGEAAAIETDGSFTFDESEWVDWTAPVF